jgi:hypothetical protein
MGRRAAVRFDDSAIPAETHARISAALAAATDAASVKAVFDAESVAVGASDGRGDAGGGGDRADTLIDAEWSAAVAWAKKAVGEG